MKVILNSGRRLGWMLFEYCHACALSFLTGTHRKGLMSFLLKSFTSLYQLCTAEGQSCCPFGVTPIVDIWYTFWPT
jgi:hypothetical protein